MKIKIPKEVVDVVSELKENGFKAFVVGGCVRDILMGLKPNDWDIATSASPEQIQKIFKNSFYNNKFFTVTVVTNSEEKSLKTIEITTFRSEYGYKDKRHPKVIKPANKIEDDLKRRDFTINSIALDIKGGDTNYAEVDFIDPFGGVYDIKNKIIKAVGDPKERFSEDALRIIRAVRFLSTLGDGWKIEQNTADAIKKMSKHIKYVSFERIRDELIKMILNDKTGDSIENLRKYGLLEHIIPELLEGYGVSQNKHHIYDVYTHNINSYKYAVSQNFSLEVRIASLLHDVGKPRVKKGEGPNATFYNHEVVGAKMAYSILNRLKFPSKTINKICKLIRYHLFYYNVGEVTPSSIRRLLKAVGRENIEELIQLRMADRIGSGCPKAEPYKLRHFKYIVEKVSQDAISTSMLEVDGNDVMRELNINPSQKVGWILNILLAEVIEDASKNKREYLLNRIKNLGRMSDKDLKELFLKSKEYIDKIEVKKDEMLKKKYWVS